MPWSRSPLTDLETNESSIGTQAGCNIVFHATTAGAEARVETIGGAWEAAGLDVSRRDITNGVVIRTEDYVIGVRPAEGSDAEEIVVAMTVADRFPVDGLAEALEAVSAED